MTGPVSWIPSDASLDRFEVALGASTEIYEALTGIACAHGLHPYEMVGIIQEFQQLLLAGAIVAKTAPRTADE